MRGLLERERPEVVCVELDQARYQTLTKPDAWRDLAIRSVLRSRRGFLLLANMVLAAFQRRMGMDAQVRPGAEMLAAVEEAEAAGARVELCDRDVQVTLRRAWSQSGLWGRSKLLSALLVTGFSSEKPDPQEIERLKTDGALTSMNLRACRVPAEGQGGADRRARPLPGCPHLAGGPRRRSGRRADRRRAGRRPQGRGRTRVAGDRRRRRNCPTPMSSARRRRARRSAGSCRGWCRPSSAAVIGDRLRAVGHRSDADDARPVGPDQRIARFPGGAGRPGAPGHGDRLVPGGAHHVDEPDDRRGVRQRRGGGLGPQTARQRFPSRCRTT